MMPA
jgi:hypothetical protein